VKPRAGLGEGAVADGAHGARLAEQRCIELVEQRLLRAGTHRQQRRDQCRQRQLSSAAEGAREVRMPRALSELRRGDEIGEFQQQRLDVRFAGSNPGA
jgi:hypothetical protein